MDGAVRTSGPPNGEHDAFLGELRGIVGAAQVLANESDRAGYERDMTGRHTGSCVAVVVPANTDEVSQVVRCAARHDVTITAQGGNTGLCGGASPTAPRKQIVLALRRLNEIGPIDKGSRLVEVGAGVVLQTLQEAAEEHGLLFPLSFGAKGSCTIGGAISTNAGGSNVLRYGTMRALVAGVEFVLADGSVVNLMSRLVKDNTGYDLKDLVVGAEGTLGIVTRAILTLVPRPCAYATALVAMRTVEDALQLLDELQHETADSVEAFEFMPDQHFRDHARMFPGRPVLLAQPGPVNILIEIGAASPLLYREGSDGRAAVHDILQDVLARHLEAGTISDALIAQSRTQRDAIWRSREDSYELMSLYGPMVDHDVALPVAHVAAFLHRARTLVEGIAPGHVECVVGHLGDGNLHYSVGPAEGAEPFCLPVAERITVIVEELVAELGGSFSAEHGIGTSKLVSMERCKDPAALDAMRRVKAALDPHDAMNPGKLLPPRPQPTPSR